LLFILLLAVVFVAGCGGGGKKINGVADEEGQVMAEGREAAGENLPTTYVVEEGDKLWTIAEKADVYGNKWQWPLVYDANRDKIDSYNDSLSEGDKLIIPRNVSAVEIEAAKERAMELGIPPGSKSAGGVTDDEVAEDEEVITQEAGADTAATDTEASATDLGIDQQPTPIPEAPKAKKKGGALWIVILLLLLVGGAVAVIFFMQKKKEEEEETKDDSGSAGGSGSGILT
jgi:hypothetical protein